MYVFIYIFIPTLNTLNFPTRLRSPKMLQQRRIPQLLMRPLTRPSSSLKSLVNSNLIYMTVHINSFPFLISPNDTIHLPFNLPSLPLGSILRMTTVSRIGSRDYTLQGHPYIDPKFFTLKMRVVEHTKQPLVITVKTKQRQRRARHLPNKQNYTVLKYCIFELC